MTTLITGATGFVGRHLAKLCAQSGDEVVGAGRRPPSQADPPDSLSRYVDLDVTDDSAVRELIASDAPDRIFHLAGEASVSESWRAPATTIEVNLRGAVNVLEAARELAPSARVLLACSGEEYGPVPTEELPITEDRPLRPQSPYGASKAAIDVLGGFYADAFGLHVTRARSFNHVGPGQSATYIIPALARQIAEARARGDARIEVVAGNLELRRDFTDVRDVVRAYVLLLDHAGPGAYNVCSGASVALSELLQGLARIAGIEATSRVDPARLRPGEPADVRGSHDRLTAATRWEPETPLEDTLRDVLASWEAPLPREAHV